MPARKRRPWLLTGLALTTVALFAVVFVAASGANLSGSTFEGNDGNLVSNGGTDWSAGAPNLSAGQDVQNKQADNSFGNGTKEDDNTPTVVTGSIPNSKANLARFAIANENIGGDEYMYLAWSREDQSGTVNFDFEINAGQQPDLTTPGQKTLNRAVNDLLINYSFQGGSNTPTLTVRKWAGSAWGPEATISSNCSEGATNSAAVSENLGGFPAVSRPAQLFGEAAINLVCAGVVQHNACQTFSSAYVKSRSSTSFTSEVKDFIAPIHISGNNCGKLTIIKHTSPSGLNQAFGYHTTGGLSPGTFSLNDAATNTQVFDNLQPGTYTVSEDADPTGFAFASLNCVGAGGSSAGRIATAVIVGGSDITCTYINNQQLGAIKVLKSSVKGQALAGAVFSIAGQSKTTGADGTACVDHLPFGSYDVQETAAPAGYSRDDTSVHSVSVNVNQDCSGISAAQALAFNDTPLTDITATAHSEAPGGTSSSIHCVDASSAEQGNSPQSGENPAVAANGLAPGTYTCTIVVDP